MDKLLLFVRRLGDWLPEDLQCADQSGCAQRGELDSAGLVRVQGLLRELNPGPLAPWARIIPLDQAAN